MSFTGNLGVTHGGIFIAHSHGIATTLNNHAQPPNNHPPLHPLPQKTDGQKPTTNNQQRQSKLDKPSVMATLV
jgi:hypothetical protein